MSSRLVLVASLAAMLMVVASSSASVAGHFKEFPIPTANSEPRRIAAGPDGALWFTEFRASQIGRITTGGTITEFPVAGSTFPFDIAAGPDGRMWFTEFDFADVFELNGDRFGQHRVYFDTMALMAQLGTPPAAPA